MRAGCKENSSFIQNRKNLKSFSNEDFNLSFKSKAQNERMALSEVLLHTAEAERRQIYLSMGYPNLFAYMTEYLGYANGCAQRRIDAARLSYDVPQVIEDLEKGSIKISQVDLLQRALRQAKQEAKKTEHNNSLPVSAAAKSELLENLKNKSLKESEILIAQTLNIEIKQSPKVLHQANESVRLEVTLDKSQWEKILEMRELLSHSLSKGSQWDQVFEYLADKVIAQKRPKTKSAKDQNLEEARSQQTTKVNNEQTFEKTQTNEDQKISFNKLRAQVLERDRCCQYKNPDTGKVCQSKWKLEIDHIKPKWMNGKDSLENLRAFCANHNQYRYRNQAGIKRT